MFGGDIFFGGAWNYWGLGKSIPVRKDFPIFGKMIKHS